MTDKTKRRNYKSSTLFGLVLGFVAIFGAFIWEGGTVNTLFMLPAMLIVFGGTLAAGIAGTSLEQVLKMPLLIKIALFPRKYNRIEIIDQIIEMAALARKKGFLVIEDRLRKIEHPLMRKLFQICVDGADSDALQKIFDIEVGFISERHEENSKLFIKLGGYSPTMGIIGTVMGLISTLAAAGSDPTILIHHIATAFIATMWGIFMANIVWLPIGDKLKHLHNEEIQLFHIMLEGVMSVQTGEIPAVIRAKLISAFPLSEQEKLASLHPKNIADYYSPVEKFETQPQIFS